MSVSSSSDHDTDSETCNLRRENSRLRADLEDCQAQLLMVLRGDQVPDAVIQRKYEDLYSSIEGWVDDVVYYVNAKEFEVVWKRSLQVEQGERNLEKLGLYTNLAATADRKQSWKPDGAWNLVLEVGKQPCCNCFIVSLVICRFLERHIFENAYLLGISNDKTKPKHGLRASSLLRSVFEALKKDEKEIDQFSRARRWRSETLTALATTSEFRERQKDEIRRLSDLLSKELKMWIGPKSSMLEALRYDILEPAVSLHNAIRCSRQDYEINPPSSSSKSVSEQERRDWRLIDIANWRIMGTDTESMDDMLLVRCLFPGLYRLGSPQGGNKPPELVKPLVVIMDGRSPSMRGSIASLLDHHRSDPESRPDTLRESNFEPATKSVSTPSWWLAPFLPRYPRQR
ncbi:hypothetical protein LTR27_006926 [Elasticomyces elasticus]|nr:hypothetical protein LTR27_006926 [Elasticomyces elasticus]